MHIEKIRTSVKVTFEDGNYLYSTINTDLAGALRYYLGQVFNVGVEEDKLVKCVDVEVIS